MTRHLQICKEKKKQDKIKAKSLEEKLLETTIELKIKKKL